MSIIDEKMPELDPTIWYYYNGKYRLRPEVDSKVRKLARKLLVGTKVKRAYAVGSLAGYFYRQDSDLDITLVVDADDELILALEENTKTVNGKLVHGTRHPINFYVMQEIPDLIRFDGVYDLIRQRWVKSPTETGVDLFSVYDQFKNDLAKIDAAYGEAWRSLIDIDLMREALRYGGAREVAVKLKRRIDDLDDAVQDLANTYDEVHQERLRAFKRQLELAELRQNPYPSPSMVPENIRYKLLERYHYLNFLRELFDLIERTNKIETKHDVREAQNILTSRFQGKSLKSALEKANASWR